MCIEVYMCNRKVVNGPTKQPEVVYPTGKRTMWAGDGYITDDNKQGDNNGKYPYWYPPPQDERRPEMLCVQQRELRQSRLFITYSLHRPTTNEQEGQLIMKKMADAAYELFGNDKWLAYMIRCGQKLYSYTAETGQPDDNVSRAGCRHRRGPLRNYARLEVWSGVKERGGARGSRGVCPRTNLLFVCLLRRGRYETR